MPKAAAASLQGLGGTGYDTAVADTNALMAAHPDWVFAGVLWHQGESDAGSATYEADIDGLITGLRADITAATAQTPVIVGRIKSGSTAYDAGTDAIIAGTATRCAYTAVVSVEDLSLLGDNLHFDGDSLDTLGHRYFAALAEARANTSVLPDQVTGLVVTPGDGALSLRWNAPSSNRAEIEDYIVEISLDGTTWSAVADGINTANSTLTNGMTHFLRVLALNAVGTGPVSDVATGTPVAAPAGVRILSYDQAMSTANGAGYSFSGLDTDTGIVVVGVSHRGGTSVSAVAIEGIAATALGQPLTLPGGQSQQFFYVTGHIGNTADIDVTLSASSSRCGVHVWTLSGADMSGASVSTASNGASGSTLATTVDVGADSVVLGLMTTITPPPLRSHGAA